MSGPISRFFAEDHRRLDALLREAVATPGRVDPGPYAAFRAGLLRHIALEEKILLPALREILGPEPLPDHRRFRIDHGAIASLLVPPPTPQLVEEIRSILEPHNQFEEAPEGLYALADAKLATEADDLLARARRYPEVRVAAYFDGPRVCHTAEEALRGSARQFDPKKGR